MRSVEGGKGYNQTAQPTARKHNIWKDAQAPRPRNVREGCVAKNKVIGSNHFFRASERGGEGCGINLISYITDRMLHGKAF